MDNDDHEIKRGDTGIRILVTLLFCLVLHAVEAVLAVVILFGLGYALLTRSEPSERVRGFANRVISYAYRIGRYLTYNAASPPFPFSGFPDDLEPTGSGEAGQAVADGASPA